MDEWLNDYFYASLNNKSKKLIVDTKWCNDSVTTSNIAKTNCDNFTASKKIAILSFRRLQ